MFTTFAHAGHDHNEEEPATQTTTEVAEKKFSPTMQEDVMSAHNNTETSAEFSPLPIILVGAGAILAVAIFISVVLYKTKSVKKKA